MTKEFFNKKYLNRDSCYIRWIRSTKAHRVHVMGQMYQKPYVRGAPHPYVLYVLHPQAHALGLESLHNMLRNSYEKRCRDFYAIVSYPMQISGLCIGIKSIIHAVEYPMVALWVCAAIVLRPAILDGWNRYYLRGMLMQSQLPFESWALLSVWHRHNISWHQMEEIVLKTSLDVYNIVGSIRRQGSLEQVLSIVGDGEDITLESCVGRYQSKYYLENTYCAMAVAGMYYGMLVYVCIQWIGWLSGPLRAMEAEWLGL